MSIEHNETSNFSFEISGMEELYNRIRLMINYSADYASPEELLLMTILHPALGNKEDIETDFPWRKYTVPSYNKVIDADPLFEEVNIEIQGGLSLKDGECASINIVFWFHRMSELDRHPQKLIEKAPNVIQLMRERLHGTSFELNLSEISGYGDREIVIQDTASVVQGHMYFGADINKRKGPDFVYQQDDEKDLIAFELDLPVDRESFMVTMPKVQKVVEEGMNAIYMNLGLTPSYNMKLELDFTQS